MPKEFAIEVSTPAGIIWPMRVSFSDDDWGAIEDFLKFATELGDHSLTSKRFWPAARFSAGTSENPAKVKSIDDEDGRVALCLEGGAAFDAASSTFPDRQEFESFMYRMRRFVLKDAEKRTYFPRILKMFSNRIPLPWWKQLLDRFTGRYSHRHMRFTVHKDGRPQELVSDAALDKWTNAFEHRYPRDLWRTLLEAIGESATVMARRW